MDTNLLNGERHFERFDRLTGEVATRAPAARLDDADAAVSAAAAAFPAWSVLGPAEHRDRTTA